MANIAAAKKSIRSSAKKASVNRKVRRAYKSARKAVMDAIKTGSKKDAEKLLPAAYKTIDKAAKINVLHPKTAARYKSRLSKQVAAL